MYIRILRASFILTVAVVSAACSRDRALTCEPDERYRASVSMPPLQVPEDLTVPDESEALRIPGPSQGERADASSGLPCLETPPDFFDETDNSD